MSIDLSVRCFRNSQTSKFPRLIAERIFDRRALRQSNLSCVEYADGRGALLLWPSPNIWMSITDAAVLRHLPDELKAEGYARAIVRTVDDLWAAIDA